MTEAKQARGFWMNNQNPGQFACCASRNWLSSSRFQSPRSTGGDTAGRGPLQFESAGTCVSIRPIFLAGLTRGKRHRPPVSQGDALKAALTSPRWRSTTSIPKEAR